MFKDWIWAGFVTLGLWLEVLGLGFTLSRIFRLPSLLALTTGLALLLQFHFLLAWAGMTKPVVHFGMILLGAISTLWFFPRHDSESDWNLRLARYFSIMAWKRIWAWLVLPIVWAILATINALIPHNASAPLTIHLASAHRWYENAHQNWNALAPLQGLASLWESLFYHIQVLHHAMTHSHRTALVRAQISSQLLHLSLGSGLTILITAGLLAPLIHLGWSHLVHVEASAKRRHQLGMAGQIAVPSSIFFAWIACVHPRLGWTAPLALNTYGSVLLVFAALAQVLGHHPVWAGFLLGTSVAVNPTSATAVFGILALTFWRPERNQVYLTLVSTLLGLALWIIRNQLIAGAPFYPWDDPFGPQWIPQWLEGVHLRPFLGLPTQGWDFLVALLTVLGLGFLIYQSFIRKEEFETKVLVQKILAFTLTSALGALLVRSPWPAYLVVALVLCGVLGVESFFIDLASRFSTLPAHTLRYFWLALGLALVPLPFHVVWQHLEYAFRPTETYLETYHKHFSAKRWASLQLSRTDRMAWTSDHEFYYLEQESTSISHSRALQTALEKASTPSQRAQKLCDLGYDVLAWEERSHGLEVAGLGGWLNLNKSAHLYQGEDIQLFRLPCSR